jgi:hypothetical protein
VFTLAEDLRRGAIQDDGGLPPLGLSIKETARITGESKWTVEQRLRRGEYRAKKSGRRTLVVFASVRNYWDSLPNASFKAPVKRKRTDLIEETI